MCPKRNSIEIMIQLFVSRYHRIETFEHKTFLEAATDAIRDLNSDASYPVKITEGDHILWEHDGPLGKEIDKLREIAGKENR